MIPKYKLYSAISNTVLMKKKLVIYHISYFMRHISHIRKQNYMRRNISFIRVYIYTFLSSLFYFYNYYFFFNTENLFIQTAFSFHKILCLIFFYVRTFLY